MRGDALRPGPAGGGPMKYQTILFDFDGTLLYTVEDLANAVNYAIAKRGYPTHSVPAIQRMVGNGVNKLVARALPQGFDTPDYEAIMDDFRTHYQQHCFDSTRPYDGVLEMLRAFQAQGRKMAIVTNKYQTAAEAMRLRFFSEAVPLIVGDLEGRARKPAPDGCRIALEALGSDGSDAVYVGDTEVDQQTAQNAGLAFAAVSWGYRSRAELEALGIETIAGRPEELLDLI